MESGMLDWLQGVFLLGLRRGNVGGTLCHTVFSHVVFVFDSFLDVVY